MSTVLCPHLTMAKMIGHEIAKSIKPQIVAPPGTKKPEQEAPGVACQGPSCAWFVAEANAEGQIVTGRCAIALNPIGIAATANTLAAVAAALDEQTKVKPA